METIIWALGNDKNGSHSKTKWTREKVIVSFLMRTYEFFILCKIIWGCSGKIMKKQ